MRYLLGLSILFSVVLFAGCKDEGPDPNEPPPPPPPKTANEMYSDYLASLKPLFDAIQVGGFGPGMKEPIIGDFRNKRAQYTSEINEPEAVDRIEKEVSANISKAEDAENWFVLDGLLDVHKLVNPTSQRYQSVRKTTDLMMARPWIMVTGFATIDANDLQVFLTVQDPLTGKQDDLRVREGEEFYPDAEGKSVLRLVKVIGNQSSVEFEYLKLPGYTWEEPGPKNR